MKKIIFTIFALGSLLTACSNAEDVLESQAQEIKLTASVVPQTRGTDVEEQSTFINEGQQVGITITGANTEHQNVAWTVLTGGELKNTQTPVYYYGGKTLSVKAYYPYNANWMDLTNNTYDFSVATDQSSTGYANSDLMVAHNLVSATNTAVNLTFQHLMAKVIVNLDEGIGDVEDVSILNTIPNSKVKGETITVVATGTAEAIKAGAGKNVAALIVPQTLSGGTNFIQIKIKDDFRTSTFVYELPSDQTFESGKVYTYNLTLDAFLPDYYYEEF